MDEPLDGIAIIGLAGRFPGAANVEEFWQNLVAGRESIARLGREELRAAGVPDADLDDPNYVRAAPLLSDIELFDANFFGFTPNEAEITDPQHRLFLECAWEALESAACDPRRYDGRIGVFAGCGIDNYFLTQLLASGGLPQAVDPLQVLIGNDKDYLATQVSYKLDLKGPSVAVQTACSTALVATNLAAQSLLAYQCDVALAGAVCLEVPQLRGYLYQEGGIVSPDGHCRPFDAAARGTVFGSGSGAVVLKRLEDALEEGDPIRAVIRGSAINNDGKAKVGYTAPSQQGQADVIALAQAIAEIEPEDFGYVEAHGTGTPLGDPVEIAALTEVFRAHTDATGFCALGSVKSNIGHLNTAAGLAGLIKTILVLERGQIPPTLHFERPNPRCELADSPFYVNRELLPWPRQDSPRRAGVSSFGVGGSNAHAVLEQAPPPSTSGPSRPFQLMLLSAHSLQALDDATRNLARDLEGREEGELADVAYTLQVGRSVFEHRRFAVCSGIEDATGKLRELDPRQVTTGSQRRRNRPVGFLFPGQGSQYPGMAEGLYRNEPAFREAVDRCCEKLAPEFDIDLRQVIFATDGTDAELEHTALTQPAIFIVDYALAQLWMSWGVRPQAMAGHSVGEYVAACLAGVFRLEDALRLVVARGRLMQQLPTGAMLALALPEDEALTLAAAHPGIELAVVNGPALCVVSGPTEAIESLEAELQTRDLKPRRLHTSHAFHSAMMEPALEPYAEVLRTIDLGVRRIPFTSNVGGGWIREQDAIDPAYWVRHLRQTVRFGDNLAALFEEPDRVLLEAGPGTALTNLARRHPERDPEQLVISSTRHPDDAHDDQQVLLASLGRLWLSGVEIDWDEFSVAEQRRRLTLPTYPFDRQRYWLEPIAANRAGASPQSLGWFRMPVWKQAPALRPAGDLGTEEPAVVLFTDRCGLSERLATRLRQAGRRVVEVQAGDRSEPQGNDRYQLDPRGRRRVSHTAL